MGFAFSNLFGRFFGNAGSRFIATSFLFLSFFLSCFAFYEVAIAGSVCQVNLCNWVNSELLVAQWSFYFDTMTVVMLLVVTSVSSLVHLYSIEYMSDDPHQGRFFGYLSLFTGFMLLLVSADNFLIMFLGWEGIGLASFLLISFWCNRIQAGKSAIKAMLVNRVGDLGLVLALCTVFITFKTLDYSVVFGLVPEAVGLKTSFLSMELDRFTIIAFFLFWGALGKSAQLGLHVWLPDAMEGPTPVSALIHAATLVTAGVFLIIRCSFIFEHTQTALLIVSIFGALTAFFASSVGIVQNDIKRVIAFSTCSQLGYMIFACGLSQYSIAFFHLANHALFKALLFLSAGSIIHGFGDEQDMRRFGNLLKVFPVAYVMILVGSIALGGIPFFTGFYSKDAILGAAITNCSANSQFAFLLGILAASCTAFYSTRLMFYTFVNKANSFKVNMENAHESTFRTWVPLLLLGFGSIFGGFLMRDMFLGFGSPFFGNAIFSLYQPVILDFEFLSPLMKNIPLFLTLFGIGLAFTLLKADFSIKNHSPVIFDIKTQDDSKSLISSKSFRTLYTFLSKKWHFDQIVNEFFVHKTMMFSYKNTFILIDKGLIERANPLGLSYTFDVLKKNVAYLHSGAINHYLLALLSFFIIIFFFSLWKIFINSVFFFLLISYGIFSFSASIWARV
jgi:proton-translocating NADH-quinone oxidoreductase chain L